MSKKKKPTLEGVIHWAACVEINATLFQDDPKKEKQFHHYTIEALEIAAHFFDVDFIEADHLMLEEKQRMLRKEEIIEL